MEVAKRYELSDEEAEGRITDIRDARRKIGKNGDNF
jgi:hypothetical protein